MTDRSASEPHAPVPIYTECGHDHDPDIDDGAIDIPGVGRTCEIAYYVCGSCCIEKISDENSVRNQTEECEMSHAHGIASFCPQIDAPQMNAPPPTPTTGSW